MRSATAHKLLTHFNSILLTLMLVAGAPLAALASGTTSSTTQSSTSARVKVSSDLRQKVNTAKPSDHIQVVMQSVSAWSKTLDSAVSSNSGTIKQSFKNFNLRVVDLPAAAVSALSSRTDVSYMSLNRNLKQLGHVTLTTGTDAARSLAPGTTLDGSGIGIAVIDSGIDPNHAAISARVKGNVDFTGEGRTDDPYGHGTHVAGLAAGSNQISNGAYTGVALNANIYNLRVLNSLGTGDSGSLLSALDWVMTNRTLYNIRVVNMSLGAPAVDSYTIDPLCIAARNLVNAGIVVVAAAGNQGKNGSGQKVYGMIHSPGIEPSVITVGAVNTFGTNSRADDGITTYSSRGPTRGYWTDVSGVNHYDNLVKPDIAAPG